MTPALTSIGKLTAWSVTHGGTLAMLLKSMFFKKKILQLNWEKVK
jgi:hypothetical protein